MKQKDLHYLKFPALPENTGAFRQWRNSVVFMLSAFNRSADASVHAWVMRALNAGTETDVSDFQKSSGNYQLLDRISASALTRPEIAESITLVSSFKDSWRFRSSRTPAKGQGVAEHGL